MKTINRYNKANGVVAACLRFVFPSFLPFLISFGLVIEDICNTCNPKAFCFPFSVHFRRPVVGRFAFALLCSALFLASSSLLLLLLLHVLSPLLPSLCGRVPLPGATFPRALSPQSFKSLKFPICDIFCSSVVTRSQSNLNAHAWIVYVEYRDHLPTIVLNSRLPCPHVMGSPLSHNTRHGLLVLIHPPVLLKA